MGKKADEDSHEFRSAVSGVKPLTVDLPPAELQRRPPRPRQLKHRRAGSQTVPGSSAPGSGQAPAIEDSGVGPEDTLSFRRGGVQDQVMRRLRRGLFPIDDELDLHGLLVVEAWDALSEFLRASRDSGFRCVRIVHGKGHRSGTRGPVLKAAVDSWLRHNHDVIGFCSARALDGGAGALYVLLRA